MKKQFTEIPEAYKITSLLHQKTYLVNGELKEWKGDVAEVYSTISSTKEYKPTLLGRREPSVPPRIGSMRG